jgi:hypothetical protein
MAEAVPLLGNALADPDWAAGKPGLKRRDPGPLSVGVSSARERLPLAGSTGGGARRSSAAASRVEYSAAEHAAAAVAPGVAMFDVEAVIFAPTSPASDNTIAAVAVE